MRIPTRAEFAPLPEVIERFGLPDPLEVLPLLENRLEAVPASSAKVREIAAGLRGAAHELDTEAGAVIWHGEAADKFRSRIAAATLSWKEVADLLDKWAQDADEVSEETKKTIKEIAKAIMVASGIVVPFLAYAGLRLPAFIVGLIGGLAAAVYFYLDQFLWFAYVTSEAWEQTRFTPWQA